MAVAHWFNPANDTALALDSPGFTPSRAAAAMESDGSLLPLWWAAEGDVVLSPRVAEGEALKRRFGLKGTVVPTIDRKIDRLAPWGWSRYAAFQLRKLGAPDHLLPDSRDLERLRSLSHRRLTVEINRRLLEMLPGRPFPPVPREVSHLSKLALERPPVYLKLPWSSSGRGVLRFDTLDAQAISEASGMIRRQGSILVEDALDRIVDFAMLFYSDGGVVSYKGLSLFETDRTGAYLGNLVADDDYMRKRIAYGPLDEVATSLEIILTDLIGIDYSGWLGVDMMTWRMVDGSTGLAPCVEVNLRMTMGVVARYMRVNSMVAPMAPCHFSVGCACIPESVDVGGAAPDSRFRFCLRKF